MLANSLKKFNFQHYFKASRLTFTQFYKFLFFVCLHKQQTWAGPTYSESTFKIDFDVHDITKIFQFKNHMWC